MRIMNAEDFGLGINCMARMYIKTFDQNILDVLLEAIYEYAKYLDLRTVAGILRDLTSIVGYPYDYDECVNKRRQCANKPVLIDNMCGLCVGKSEMHDSKYGSCTDKFGPCAGKCGMHDGKYGSCTDKFGPCVGKCEHMSMVKEIITTLTYRGFYLFAQDYNSRVGSKFNSNINPEINSGNDSEVIYDEKLVLAYGYEVYSSVNNKSKFDNDMFLKWVLDNELNINTSYITMRHYHYNSLPLKKSKLNIFTSVCFYMLKYSYTRHSYMPQLCSDFIKANIPIMPNDFLRTMADYLFSNNSKAYDGYNPDNQMYNRIWQELEETINCEIELRNRQRLFDYRHDLRN